MPATPQTLLMQGQGGGSDAPLLLLFGLGIGGAAPPPPAGTVLSPDWIGLRLGIGV